MHAHHSGTRTRSPHLGSHQRITRSRSGNVLSSDEAEPGTVKNPEKHERKIRNENVVMFWLKSRGCEAIHGPSRPGTNIGDLYLHLFGENTVQIWMWDGVSSWDSIEEGYVHPLLPNRRLWLQTRDEPSWVTRKTATTYKGRLHK